MTLAEAREIIGNQLDDTDEEPDEQELESHYLYMEKIQKVPSTESWPMFDAEPLKTIHTDDVYNVFSNDQEHMDQHENMNDTSMMEKVDSNTTPDSSYIQKQLKKANASLTHELNEWKSALAEVNDICDRCRSVLQHQEIKLEKYKKYKDCQIEKEELKSVVVVRWWQRWRVEESDMDERVYRVTTNLFGFAGKIPPEKFSGGGRRRALEFQTGDHVFLKVSPTRGVRRFGIKAKLSPRFIGPFEILDRVGEVSYRLALPPQLSHVHDVFHVSLLRGYKYHPLHVITCPLDQIRTDLSYVEEPEAILDRQDEIMRKKTIPFVKILWRNHPEREATWETEESIWTSYPHFLP
nr:hypothetical protein [Tanacetum cinerariifolium]